MPMIQDILTSSLRGALVALGVDPVPERIPVERSNRPELGDWSSSVALAAAKASGRRPRDLADELAARLGADPPAYVAEITVAGPGFVNFRLHDRWLHDVLTEVIEQGAEGYARHDLGHGEGVNVEFVSANPTGPLHVGAGRWAVYGDALCRILEQCGYGVHREYYVNDRGVQMGLLAASVAAAKAGRPTPDDGYKGQYISDWAAELPDDADPAVWAPQRAVAEIQGALGALNVRFDTWFSEKSMVESGAIDAALTDLRASGLVYENDGATWLRTTDLGLAKDEVILKTGGEPTYLLGDLAYHRDKFTRGFTRLIDIWGADHHGHVARLKAGVQALGHDPDELEIVLGQLVTVERGGEVVRMGKRSGTFVELAEVVEEVGPDVARLTFLLQSIDTRQTFDLDAVVTKSMDNPVFYVQYAHARIASIARVAAERNLPRYPLEMVDLSELTHPRELDLLRSLGELPEVVADACRTRAPHKVATWVRELAGRFHGFYHDCYVMGEGVSHEQTQARLWLVESTRIGLAIGLGLLGVSAPDSM
ncbi:MAG TPA: arginine--tRNA ligase [Acidimicrobiales bacterium]|nr:arginine--tRNA ligase [Acidimicrobiales bacterium]